MKFRETELSCGKGMRIDKAPESALAPGGTLKGGLRATTVRVKPSSDEFPFPGLRPDSSCGNDRVQPDSAVYKSTSMSNGQVSDALI